MCFFLLPYTLYDFVYPRKEVDLASHYDVDVWRSKWESHASGVTTCILVSMTGFIACFVIYLELFNVFDPFFSHMIHRYSEWGNVGGGFGQSMLSIVNVSLLFIMTSCWFLFKVAGPLFLVILIVVLTLFTLASCFQLGRHMILAYFLPWFHHMSKGRREREEVDRITSKKLQEMGNRFVRETMGVNVGVDNQV
jgi:hypothetical protein